MNIEQIKNEVKASVLAYDSPECVVNSAITCIRQAIADEQKTVVEYMQFSEQVSSCFPSISELFKSIADEEKVHIGELEAMLKNLETNNEFNRQGADEVKSIEDKTINTITLAKIEQILAETTNEGFENKSDYYRTVINKIITE